MISTDRRTAATALDQAWDGVVEQSPLGQFQQTSGWAATKALTGWGRTLVWADAADPAAGGLQLLWKQTRIGRIGYVTKGPILRDETPETIGRALTALTRQARELGLAAVLLQPPDRSQISSAQLVQHGFIARPIESVTNATALVDLSGGREAMLSRMNRQARREARQGLARGLIVREGDKRDLRTFFELMEGSCRRQGTQPNPGRLEILEHLWDALRPRIRLGLALANDMPIAGLLMIGFGDRLTFWKKGWNNQSPELHANSALNVEALGWAVDWGYREVDFLALDRGIALRLLADEALSEEQRRSRHLFNLRLGAQPLLLPSAHVLVVNRVLRPAVGFGLRFPRVQQALVGGQ